jgi:CubicO group peptidase (beta-lactamase class C family)
MNRRDMLRGAGAGLATILGAAGLGAAGLGAAGVAAAAGPPDVPANAAPAKADNDTPPAPLDTMLEPYLAEYKLPALAAAVVKDGNIVAAGAVGTRRLGTDNPVGLDDRFHIGSDAKAMTALLAAMLVEQGKLRWDGTVAEVFPELAGAMAPQVGAIRLDQLLSHTSGIPSDSDADDKLVLASYSQTGMNLDELRYWVVKQLVARPLQSAPGERFAYANMGYLLVGAMIERLNGATWEELVASRIFDPLELDTAGFGPQASLGRIDAPLGHRPMPDGPAKPMLAGPNGDNPEVMGPAGTVHLSILDFAAWAGWNTGEGKRGPALVKPETLRKLHTPVVDIPPSPDAKPGTPPPGKYGLGWGTVSLPFAPEPLIFHGGSNEMNLAYIFLQPSVDFGVVMATNIGGEKADAALKALGRELYQRFAKAS